MTSNCQYNQCDGSGIIYNWENNSVSFCRCRAQQLLDRKLQFAAIPKEFKELTVRSFNTSLYSSQESRERAILAKKAAANFVINFEKMKALGKGLYFYSYIKGSGKTRLAASIGNALIRKKRIRVKFITTIDLLKAIQSTYNKDSKTTESELLYAIKEVDVLILDDIGVETPKSWVDEIFYSILNGRMVSNNITIFTSNTTIEELKHEERIKNRIERMAVPIYLPDESIRSQLARKENEELQALLYK